LRYERHLRTDERVSLVVAGPRGAGKSTLIDAFCKGKPHFLMVHHQMLDRRIGSAPVTYEAKDFILHLFAQPCMSVVGVREWIGSGDEIEPEGRITDPCGGESLTAAAIISAVITGLERGSWDYCCEDPALIPTSTRAGELFRYFS